MKEILRHLFQTDPEGLQERTLMHCHVEGVHSIVLYDVDGARLRLFYATKNHHLNFDANTFANLPVGFHAHHCDVTLYVLHGLLYNFTVDTDRKATGPCFNFNRYAYTSSITHEKGKMEYVSKMLTSVPKQDPIKKGQIVNMRAREIHTVGIDQYETCIWAVMEGNEDPAYDNFLLTTRELTDDSTKGLYQKPNMDQFNAIVLEMINLL